MTTAEEIWSTRLQREILALTDKTEDGKDIGILPDFIKYNDHSLDISKGTCLVSFAITVEGVDRTPTPPVAKSVKEKVNAALGEEDSDEAEITNEEESAKVDDEESVQKSTNDETSSEPAPSTFKVQVIVTFDASLQKRSSAFNASTSYPFFKPKAILTSGAEHFTASKIENGNELVIDCDWTPSLHLNDAAMNIALKVRESIKRGEPCLKVVVEKKTLKHVEEDLLEEVKADISKAGAKVSSFFSDLKSRASAVADEMDKAVGSGASTSNAATGTGTDTPNKPKRIPLKFPRKERAPKPLSKIVSIENISIGDEIDLAMEPWNKAVGMYPCKAIRRPAFVASAMEAAGQDSREKVATAGLSGAGSLFRSFTKSAKSALEESFLMLTEELVIEIKCNKFSVANATVSFAIPVSHLAKLKFRREESLSLFFKQAPDDPIIYMCISSSDAVKQIQHVLKRHGVKGKHTNTTMQKEIKSAIEMIEAIKNMESELKEKSEPTKEKVTFIMDLYRQAAEKFELAGDARHEEVMSSMRDFLAKPLVASILDGSFEKKLPETSEPMPQEKVEETDNETVQQNIPKEGKEEDDNVEAVVDEQMEKAMEDAENMLKDAHKDLKDLGIDDFEDDLDEISAPANEPSIKESGGDDMISEFEDMLKDADKELEELMGS